MADFLTRLMERSYGLASPVEPLIASIYAPGPTTAAHADEEQVSWLEPEAWPDDNQTSYAQSVDGAPDLASQADAASPSPAGRASRATPEAIPVVAARRVASEEEAGATSADATKRDQAQSDLTSRRLPVAPRYPEPAAVESDARAVTEAISARPVSETPIVLRPQMRTLIEQTEQPGTEPKEDRATPTIRVTIGRIEVRAVFAPTPTAQRATPPSPKLSLDDYLRSRNEGKR
jgi:hypothetical protein